MSIYKITYKDGSTNQIIGTEDFCKEVTQDGGSYEVVNLPEPSQDTIKSEARMWRNEELAITDSIAQTPDFPNRDKYLTYRQALRDWPSTADFPAKKPALE
tara:strand:- start:359 stop:661 length:303 start_codon:yes stop_codon:yes gene_type:complete